MSHHQHRSLPPTRTAIASAALSALLLAACGGGSSGDAARSYATGAIQGFGSIIVNGVHYDERGATIVDEDGDALGQRDLELGMVVEIEGGEIATTGGESSATAETIVLSSLVLGPVESVGTDGLVAVGQSVQVTATTVFEDDLVGGLASAALQPGAVVKVYGFLDVTTGVYTATRIELEDDEDEYRLRGIVSAYDPAAMTLTIGAAVVDLSRLTVPAALQVGVLARIELQTVKNADGEWVAVSLELGADAPDDADQAEIEGTITAFTSSTAFSVNGLPVDASRAVFEDGSAGVVVGARVEVEGSIVNGVLVAAKVEIETEDEDEEEGFEIEGRVSSLDAVARTFVVRGVTVSYADGAVVFEGGSADQLIVNAVVEVHGALAADGVTVNAVSIEFED